jgi:hypothetical protein
LGYHIFAFSKPRRQRYFRQESRCPGVPLFKDTSNFKMPGGNPKSRFRQAANFEKLPLNKKVLK